MKVFIQITAEVNTDKKPTTLTADQLKAAAAEAVSNAIAYAQGEGHTHALEGHDDGVSVMVDPDDVRVTGSD